MTDTNPEVRDPEADEEALGRIMARLRSMDVDDVEVPPSHDETPEQARERVRLANQSRARRWRQRLPEQFAHAGLDDLDPSVREAVEGWLASPKARNLVLVGNVGAGKTFTGYAIGNHLLGSAGRWVEATTVYDLLNDLRPDGDPMAMDRARRCDLLLLDDLGASSPTEWAAATLTAVLDARVNDRRRTIITTNFGEAALRTSWGDRFADRLRMGLAVVRFVGESRRSEAF